jgi:hypothetical protein
MAALKSRHVHLSAFAAPGIAVSQKQILKIDYLRVQISIGFHSNLGRSPFF